MLYYLGRCLFRLLFQVLGRWQVSGREHCPVTGPVILAPNHISYLDPPASGSGLHRPVHFMAKEELFRIPLFGRLIRSLNARPVRRDGSDMRALKAALAQLEEGHALLVFPEGTRGEEGQPLREGKPGVGMLAVLSGAPVVPVYVSGSGAALPRGRALPRPARVRVTFGPPLTFKRERRSEGPREGKRAGDDGRKEAYREAAQEMMRAIGQLRDRQSKS